MSRRSATKKAAAPPQTSLVKARDLRAGGDAKAALAVLDRIPADAPIRAAVLAEMADIHLRDGDLDTAGAKIAEGLEAEPGMARLLSLRSQIHQRNQRFDEEAADLHAILAANPDQRFARLRCARRALEGKDFADAIEHVDNLLRTTPDDPAVLELAAEAHLGRGDTDAASDAVARLLERATGPALERAQVLHMRLLAHGGHHKEVRHTIDAILAEGRLTPKLAHGLMQVTYITGECLFDTERLKAHISRHPNCNVSVTALRMGLRASGRFDELKAFDALGERAKSFSSKTIAARLKALSKRKLQGSAALKLMCHEIASVQPRGGPGYDEILRRAMWGREALGIVDSYLENGFDSFATYKRSFGKAIAAPDLAPIVARQSKGQGQLLVTSHLTCTHAFSPWIEAETEDLATVSLLPRPDWDLAVAGECIPMASGNVTGQLRELVQRLRRGGIVTNAPDHVSRDSATFRVGTQAFRVDRLCPWLAYKAGVATQVLQGHWRDGVLELEITTITAPRKTESEDDFTLRWVRKYFDVYRKTVLGTPEVLRPNIQWRPCVEAKGKAKLEP